MRWKHFNRFYFYLLFSQILLSLSKVLLFECKKSLKFDMKKKNTEFNLSLQVQNTYRTLVLFVKYVNLCPYRHGGVCE